LKINKGISVIIPTYNREKHITEAIESIVTQNYPGEIEIIISDDGSTDNTLILASNYSDQVKILHKPHNCMSQGASGARNRGIAAATQPFICFLDSDDFYLPGHLIRMVTTLEKNQKSGFVFCRILECEEKNKKRIYRKWTHDKILKEDIKNPVVSRSHIVHTNSFMFRREVFESAGVFNESFSNGEDGDLWMRISELFKGVFSNHFGAVYTLSHSENQLTKNKEEEIKNNYLQIFKNAKSRYYSLKLNNPYRIFKIKHTLLNLLHKNNKKVYYLKYIGLILHYPFAPWYIVKEYYYSYLKRKNTQYRDNYMYFCQMHPIHERI
jgi:glycosyltransferase involved in cell wall biosynthesis